MFKIYSSINCPKFQQSFFLCAFYGRPQLSHKIVSYFSFDVNIHAIIFYFWSCSQARTILVEWSSGCFTTCLDQHFIKKNRPVKSKQCAFPIEKFPYNLTRWELGCKFSQFWKRLHRRGEKNIKKVLTCCQLLSKLLFQTSACSQMETEQTKFRLSIKQCLNC